MQGHISLEVMKLVLTFGKRRGICTRIMQWYLFAPDSVLCLIGFARPGELPQGCYRWIKTWDLRMEIQEAIKELQYIELTINGITPSRTLSGEWDKMGISLQVHAHLKESKAKGWSLSKRLDPTSRLLCTLSLVLTGWGSWVPGGNWETTMKACQTGESHFVSKLFGILTPSPFLPPRTRCWFVKPFSQINSVCFSSQSLSSVRSGCVQLPGLPLSGSTAPAEVVIPAAPARCHHVSLPGWPRAAPSPLLQPLPRSADRVHGSKTNAVAQLRHG